MANKVTVSKRNQRNICDFLMLLVRQVEAPDRLSFEQNGLTRIAQFEPEPIGHLLQWFRGLKLSLDWRMWDLELPEVHCSSYGSPWLEWGEGFEAGSRCTDLPLPRQLKSRPFSAPIDGPNPDLAYGPALPSSYESKVIISDGERSWAIPERLVVMGLYHTKVRDRSKAEVNPNRPVADKLDLITALAASEYDAAALISSFVGAGLELDWHDYVTQVGVRISDYPVSYVPGGIGYPHSRITGRIVGVSKHTNYFEPKLILDHLSGLGETLPEEVQTIGLDPHQVIAGLRLDLP